MPKGAGRPARTKGAIVVFINRVYTRSGDQGETGLGDGARVSKDSARVEAYGTVDEVNTLIGALTAADPTNPERELMLSIMNDLFDVGADLCRPAAADEPAGEALRVTESQCQRLEQAIDRINENLAPLTSFVLPGGTVPAAWCHLARSVCRRAERRVVTLARQERVNPNVLIYLNRLSDLLFVLAREFNDRGAGDVLWTPGKTR